MESEENAPDFVFCPLVDCVIDCMDCMENSDVVKGMLPEECLLDEYKQKKNWKDICKNCRWYYC